MMRFALRLPPLDVMNFALLVAMVVVPAAVLADFADATRPRADRGTVAAQEPPLPDAVIWSNLGA